MSIISTQLLWTCLPNGVVTPGPNPVVNLSLVLTPQIFSSAPAGGTPDTIQNTVFENWPAYVRAITAASGWAVFISNTKVPATIAVDHISASSAFNVDGAQLWQSIFPSGTPVITASQATATPQFKILSYDAGAIAKAVRAAHQYVVHSHATHGKLVLTGNDPYSFLLAEHTKAKAARPRVLAALRGAGRGSTHELLRSAYQAETGDVGLGYELMRHALFFDPHKYRTENGHINPMDGTADDAGTPPTMQGDFNSLIAHLGGQPQLQRKLGLIIDLQLTLTGFPLLTGATPSPFLIWGDIIAPSSLPTTVAPASVLTLTYNTQPSTKVDIAQALFRSGIGNTNPVTTVSGGSINNGFLPLGDVVQYDTYTEDTEGTPFKLNTVTSAVATSDLTPAMPALRTAGLAVSQTGRETVLAGPSTGLLARQEAFAAALVTGSTPANPSSQVFTAEDLVRGYSVDIAVGTNPTPAQFQSLCLRDSRVFFPGLASISGYTGPTSFVLSDEGYTKATSASAQSSPNAAGVTPTAAAAQDLNLHTTLFGWEGWSLAVQRPGRAIQAAVPPGDIVQTETPVQPVNSNSGVTNFPTAQITVRARAGKLTKLRFGQSYTLRARVIDLAGNDMSVASAGASQITTGLANGAVPNQSPTMPYLRFEPVPNPVLLLQNALTEGEHLENLVIRSNPWGFSPTQGPTPMDAVAYAKAAPALDPMNTYPLSGQCTRLIAPPKGPWAQAEASAAFDTYFATMSAAVAGDLTQANSSTPPNLVPGQPYTASTSTNSASFFKAKNALFLCSQKEEGLWTDTAVWNTADTSSQTPSGTNPVQIITPPTAQNLPPPTDPGQPLAPGQYNILQAGQPVIIPYLPDANAQGFLLQQLANVVPAGLPPASPQIVSYATRTYVPRNLCTWPEIDVPQIVLQQASEPAAIPGSTAPFPNPPAQYALPSIAYTGSNVVPGLDPSAPPALAANVPPTTPPPAFTPPPTSLATTFSLAPGQQMSFLYGSSIAKPSLMASSLPGMYGNIPPYAPYRVITLTHAVQQPYPPNAGVVIKPQPAARNPGDTSVTFTGSFSVDGGTANGVVLTTSWADKVDTELTNGVEVMTDGTNIRFETKSGRIAEWTLATSDSNCSFPAGTTAASQGATGPIAPPLVQQCGDTKTRQIFFRATSTSRFREFFPASLQSNAENFQSSSPQMPLTGSDLLTTDTGVRVLATARPNPPTILYVVPTYQWGSYTSSSTTLNSRVGRGLRVFVDRPWFTTGDTEMLGVVVTSAVNSSTPTPANIAHYVSQWGQDPIRFPQSDTLPPCIDQTQLQGGTPYTNVSLLENGAQVTVVAYPPTAFDPTRNLWYFDIEFAAIAVEAPFVRLALMRFQPNALVSTVSPNVYDLRVSNVVLADMVKLSADRTATYTVNGAGSVTVTVTGHVHANASWTPGNPASSASYGRAVYAQIQELPAGVTNPGEFDWTTIGSPIPLTPTQTQGTGSTTISYVGSIAKPTGLLAGTKHQLLITEHEVFETDAAVAFPTPSGGQTIGSAVQNFPGNIALANTSTTSRVVFSDVLPLPY